jgi:psp operon transcriptional activator
LAITFDESGLQLGHDDNSRSKLIASPLVLAERSLGVLAAVTGDGKNLAPARQLLDVAASMIAQSLRIERAVLSERQKLIDENSHLRQELKEKHDFSHIVGTSNPMKHVYDQVSQVARSNATVLLRGESGTGKEMIANAIHYNSLRSKRPLIKLNCAALPDTLIEAELFGHEAGAFTGATRAREGRFEEADRGTLFLDELATLSMGAQERLLRAVEYGEVTRIGSSRPMRVDVRIVAATNEDLPKLARDGRFRLDLLDRLSFEVITLPPLRVREGDIAVLADYFGRRMAAEIGWENWTGFAEHVSRELDEYPWPGNVRELRNVVERAVYRWEYWNEPVGHVVFDPFHSPWKPLSERTHKNTEDAHGAAEPAPARTDYDSVGDLRTAVDDHERAIVEHHLGRNRWNQRQTAKALGLTYDQLRHCIKKHGLMEQDAE